MTSSVQEVSLLCNYRRDESKLQRATCKRLCGKNYKNSAVPRGQKRQGVLRPAESLRRPAARASTHLTCAASAGSPRA
ncbi:hypothetical protein EVAR_48873_1 [Eumeta japonica]|uniref:Uncharacterized protein n=1 Tax=Eumeta variegata TaxID=151549 RepID=A0A4C1Y4R7_EUMVA|nr:hypothetical protein EVAR_48873_1 [Eumeta japonica]